MKNRIVQFLILASLFSLNTLLNAQWTEIRPAYGIDLTANLIPLKGSVFTTSHYGTNHYFVKTDDLIHWQKVSEINDVAYDEVENYYDEGLFYVLSRDNGIANLTYSTDGGLSWSKIDNANFPSGGKFFHVINKQFYFANANTIYKSDDLGVNWSILKSTVNEISGFEVLPSGKLVISTSAEVLISVDKGTSWDSRSLPYAVNTIIDNFKLLSNEAGIFIAVETKGNYLLFRSKNEAQSWIDVSLKNSFSIVSSIISNSDGWWALAYYTYHSEDEGTTWDKGFYTGGDRMINVHDTLYTSGYDGFFKSYDKAHSWKSGNVGWDVIFPGFNNRPIGISEWGRTFEFYHDQLYFSHYGGIYSMDVNGDEWTQFDNSGMGPVTSNFFAKDDNIGFYGDNALISKDNGKNWIKLITPYGLDDDPYNKLNSIYAQVNGTMFSQDWLYNNLYKSDDWGFNWSQIPLNIDIKYSMAGNGNKLFANTNTGIYSSDNLGSSYSPDQAGIGANSVSLFYNTPKNIYCLYNSALYQYNNNSWKLISTGLEQLEKDFEIIKIAESDELSVASCGGVNGNNYKYMYYSTDGGNSWSDALSNTFPNIYLFQNYCTVDHQHIYFSGVDNNEHLRVFKMDYKPVSVSAVNNIEQLSIFPNPSNGIFTIKTNLQSGSWQVFNLLGAMIKEGKIKDTEIDLSGYPNGVYFITVDDGNNNKTESLILISNKL